MVVTQTHKTYQTFFKQKLNDAPLSLCNEYSAEILATIYKGIVCVLRKYYGTYGKVR